MSIFTGAGVAIVTPFHEDGSVNYEKFAELIEFQIANGTDAIIVCGTTGESSTLSHEEHLDVVGFCIKQKAFRKRNEKIFAVFVNAKTSVSVTVECNTCIESVFDNALCKRFDVC